MDMMDRPTIFDRTEAVPPIKGTLVPGLTFTPTVNSKAGKYNSSGDADGNIWPNLAGRTAVVRE
jgi:hypothetical protein